MDESFIAKHWYAYIYEQLEKQTNDVEFLLNLLQKHTGSKQKILEVACGGGRICLPLAQAGHLVTGFDFDEHMLLRCYRRMQGLKNITCYLADALTSDWGFGFDVVVLAGNLLINIETELDYAQAQQILIQKAALSLKQGGHLFLDFDLCHDPASRFNSLDTGSYFQGADDMGTRGRTVSCGSVYDPLTRICAGVSHWELETNNGRPLIYPEYWHKHIPTQAQVYGWLKEAGLVIARTYKNYSDEALPEPVDESTYRATVWAKKE